MTDLEAVSTLSDDETFVPCPPKAPTLAPSAKASGWLQEEGCGRETFGSRRFDECHQWSVWVHPGLFQALSIQPFTW